MGDLQQMQPWPLKRNFFELGDQKIAGARASSLRCGKPSRIEPAARRSVRASLRVLDRFPRCGSVLIMGAMPLPFFEEKLNRIAMKLKTE